MEENFNQLVRSMAAIVWTERKVKLKSDTSIQLDSRTFTPRQFSKFIKDEQSEFIYKLESAESVTLVSIIKDDKLEKLSDAVFEALKRKSLKIAKEKAESGVVLDVEVGNYSYRDHFKVVDIVTDDRMLFNSKLNRITDLSIEAWSDWLSHQDKNAKAAILENTAWGLISFDPYDMAPIKQVNLNEQVISQFNAHVFPEWRKEEIKNATLPEEFENFMDFFLPDEKSRRYVLSWMYWMLIDRNECHLLLHGKKGVGKNTLALICERLVGPQNSKIIDPKFWESRFNGELKYRRLCFFDEHDITEENIGQLKAYANAYLSIEEKGVKVERNYKNFASFIIANNNPSGNFLESDDRRFSVPIISKERLDHAWGRDRVAELYDTINSDDKFIGRIGWWLIQNGASLGFDNLSPLKTDLFFELVENAMTEWQRKLIELIRSRQHTEIRIEEIGIHLNLANPPGHSKLLKFLENTTDKDGDFYAYGKRTRKQGRIIVPSEKYSVESVDKESTISDDDLGLDDF